ncbi:uncharacterized protein LOC142182533 isoform X2 [Nicotiana tabacum]|uniref:Uncharacterized protein LOC142182533 isoform X2 n=1 Tax=Nicotiana tabacum TaxID=4097 RepID=A0AC58UTQ3_TOBAC
MGIMEGYKDTCITPLTDFSTTNEMVGCSSLNYGRSQRKEGPINENESMNIQKGREGRRKMAEMYSVLQSLETRQNIVAESTDYIKRLEQEIVRLENLKKSFLVDKPALSQCRNRVSSVNVTVLKGLAFFGIQFQLSQGLMTKIFCVLDKHQAEVLAANISVSDHRIATLTITVMIGHNKSDIVENIQRELFLV